MSVVRKVHFTDINDGFAVVQADLNFACVQDVANESGVSAGTLYRWREGKVKAPQFYKVVDVLVALGYSVVIKRTHESSARSRFR